MKDGGAVTISVIGIEITVSPSENTGSSANSSNGGMRVVYLVHDTLFDCQIVLRFSTDQVLVIVDRFHWNSTLITVITARGCGLSNANFLRIRKACNENTPLAVRI